MFDFVNGYQCEKYKASCQQNTAVKTYITTNGQVKTTKFKAHFFTFPLLSIPLAVGTVLAGNYISGQSIQNNRF